MPLPSTNRHLTHPTALARDKWPEVLAARFSLDRCLEAHRAAVQANKAKAFSKATLELDEEVTDDERARSEARAFLRDSIATLLAQIDELEADAGTQSGRAGGRKGKASAARGAAVISSHQAHEAQLEKLTRLLDNDVVSSEDVESIRDDVAFYIENSRVDDEFDLNLSLEMYSAIAPLRPRAPTPEVSPAIDDDQGSLPRAPNVLATNVPLQLRVCVSHARGGSRGTCHAVPCTFDHTVIDKARRVGACTFFIIGGCNFRHCGFQHLSVDEVRRMPTTSTFVQPAAVCFVCGEGGHEARQCPHRYTAPEALPPPSQTQMQPQAPQHFAIAADALRPIVVRTLRDGGGVMSIGTLGGRPGIAHFMREIKAVQAGIRFADVVQAMPGIGTRMPVGGGREVEVFELPMVSAKPQPAIAQWRSESPAGPSPPATPNSPALRPSASPAVAPTLAPLAPVSAARQDILDAAARLEAQRALGAMQLAAASASASVAVAKGCSSGGDALLFQACASGDVAVVRMLLSAGADTDIMDSNGVSPLLLSCSQRRDACALALISAGADPNARAASGLTPLLSASCFGLEDVSIALLAAGADTSVAAPGATRFSPLHLACYFGHDAIGLLLLASGAAATAQSASGATPLSLCEAGGRCPRTLGALRDLF